jgi:sugar phosphate permease
MGGVLISAIGGFLAEQFGWESIFYFSSFSNAIFIVLWIYLVSDTPEEHPTISTEERNTIVNSRKSSKKNTG